MILMQIAATDLSQPPAITQSAFRLQPDAVMTIATEFSALLREVQTKDLGPENRNRLIEVLSAFEELFIEMKEACEAVRASPGR